MAGYFGTELQKHLQAQAEASADWIRTTPGACQSGRFMGCDDPDRLGWDVIDKILERDRICGFRMLPAGSANDLTARFSERGFRVDFWDVFSAERSRALGASTAIVVRGLPDGLLDLRRARRPR